MPRIPFFARPRWLPLILLAGCMRGAPPPPAEPAPPPGVSLSWAPPTDSVTRYVLADTVAVAFEGGPLANVRIEGGYYASVALRPAPGEGLVLAATLEDFTGELRNPMAGTTRADESDVTGHWVVRVGPTGTTEVVESPAVTDELRAVVGTDDLLRNLFIRLPADPVRPGDGWTDTIRVDETTPEGRETSTSIVSSTLVGDSVVGGQTLQVIRSETDIELRLEATSDGMRVVQEMSGTTSALTLFDAERHLIVRSQEGGLMRGTIDVPAAEIVGVPLEARVRRRVLLRE